MKNCLFLFIKTLIDYNVIWDLVVQDSKGKEVDLSLYEGKVLLVVNVASKWYFSSKNFILVVLICLVQ